jgi:murein DD-endopeptidase MepM/ murein hydrolase activator NlpD
MHELFVEQQEKYRRSVPTLQPIKAPTDTLAPLKKSTTIIEQIVQTPSPIQRHHSHPQTRMQRYYRPLVSETKNKSYAKVLFALASVPLIAIVVILIVSVAAMNAPEEVVLDIQVEPGIDTGISHILASYAGFDAKSFDDIIPHVDSEEEVLFEWKSYTVKKGDTVSAIAYANGVSMDAIIASNGISNALKLPEGKVIRIPTIDGIPYTVKQGDSLSTIAAAMHVPMDIILEVNYLQSHQIIAGAALFIPGARMPSEDLKLALGGASETFIYPANGRLSSPFGWRMDPVRTTQRSFHKAIDLAANTGTPVMAAMGGKVTVIDTNPSFGKFIILTHNATYQTLYAHLSVISVQRGASVVQGQKIGEVGNTGYSTGSHLHFAIYKNGTEVNPLDYLKR